MRDWPIKKECKYCLTTAELTYDHKVPKIMGGSDDGSNIQILCRKCNSTKDRLTARHLKKLARWVYFINQKRAKKGKRPLGIRKSDLGIRNLTPLSQYNSI